MREPEPPSADRVVLDLNHLAEIREMPGMKGGSLLQEFVALFLRDEPGQLAELTDLVRQGTQREEIKRLAHSLAGSCAMLGAIQMQHAALAVQAAAPTGSPAELSARLAAVDVAWERLQSALALHGLLPPA
jgi:HPt (histidine-containing phosphotransfer) domain-containing protein